MSLLQYLGDYMGLTDKQCHDLEGEIEKKQREMLKNATYENTKEFNLKNVKCWTKPLRVYDGDTLHLAIIINDEKKRFRCRLKGIDTAELKSDDPTEREIAELTKKTLIEMLGTDLIWTEFYGNDKYGRPIVALFRGPDEHVSLNSELVLLGLAYEYNGGSRQSFKNWFENKKEKYHNPIDDNIQDSEIKKN